MFQLHFNPFRSLTIWGVIVALTPTVVAAYDPTALSPTVHTVVQSVGLFLGALGLRNAHSKTVAAIADLVAKLAGK